MLVVRARVHRPGHPGPALIIAIQFGLVLSVGVFNPVYATFRLQQIPDDRIARTLAAWSVTNNLTVATLTALWGVIAATLGLRAAIAIAGALLLVTPLLLVRIDGEAEP